MSDEEINIRILTTGAEVTGAKVKEVTRSVKELQDAMAKGFTVGAKVSGSGSVFDPTKIKSAGEAMREAGNKAKEAQGNFKDAADALTFFQKVFVGREIVKFSEALEELSDSAANLQNKMRVLSEDGETGVASKMQNVYDIAVKTGQPLESVSTGFFRLSEATKEMGATQGQVLRVTKTLNEAMAISGATSVEAKNGMIQLSQGLSLGVVKGQDLRAVISDIPVIGRAIADHFGVSIGQLRAMAAQGKVTAKEVFEALLEFTDTADTKFEGMNGTFERAWNSFRTQGVRAFQDVLLDLNKLTHGIDSLAAGFDYLISAAEIFGENWAKAWDKIESSKAYQFLKKIGSSMLDYANQGKAPTATGPNTDPNALTPLNMVNLDARVAARRAAREALLSPDPGSDTSNLKETNQLEKPKKEAGKTLEELIRLETEKNEIQRIGVNQTKEEKEVWSDYMSQVEKLKPSLKDLEADFNDQSRGTGLLFKLTQDKHDLAEVQLLIESITKSIEEQHKKMAAAGIAAGAHVSANLAKSREQVSANARSTLAETTPFNAQQQKINALQDVLAHPEAMASALNAAGRPASDLEDAMTAIRVQIQLLTAEMNPLAQAFQQVADTMVQGFSDAIAQSIVLHKNLGSLLHDLVKVAEQQAISGLIKAGIGGVANGGTGLIGLIGNAAVAGHAAGGYTGNYGVSQVAGVVHGQEYVLNAAATRSIGRANLDAMNSGAPIGNGGTKIVINNNAPGIDASASVNQQGHVEIMIQKKVAELTPHIVASQISQANSPVSKSLSRHIDANRRNV